MYYHLITKDGLKQKDLSIEEIEKILREEEVSYNNARIYSSEKKLNEVYENYKEELIEEGEDTSFENIKIEKGEILFPRLDVEKEAIIMSEMFAPKEEIKEIED